MEIAFSSNLQYAKLLNSLHIRLSHNCPSGDTETGKYLPYNFSRHDFQKLIRTQHLCLDYWIPLDLPSRRKDTHRLMSRVDYGFNQWSVVSFVIKNLYVYLFMVKQCIYLVILMYSMQIYFLVLWSGNKFTDIVVFLNFFFFFFTLHATWITKKK